jgi:hypothetical protein
MNIFVTFEMLASTSAPHSSTRQRIVSKSPFIAAINIELKGSRLDFQLQAQLTLLCMEQFETQPNNKENEDTLAIRHFIVWQSVNRGNILLCVLDLYVDFSPALVVQIPHHTVLTVLNGVENWRFVFLFHRRRAKFCVC